MQDEKTNNTKHNMSIILKHNMSITVIKGAKHNLPRALLQFWTNPKISPFLFNRSPTILESRWVSYS